MHVLHVIARLNDGGPARAIAALVEALPEFRHSVLCGSCSPGEGDATALVQAAGASVIPLPVLSRRVAPLADGLAGLQLVRAIRSQAPDLVHTHTAKAGALGRLACRLLHQPCLHTYHGHVLQGYFPRAVSLVAGHAERALAGNAWHHDLTTSQLHHLHGRWHIGRGRRWRVLPPPVPRVQRCAAAWHDQLRPSLPVVLFLGRLVKIKDPALWLQTLVLLARSRPVQGLICGAGPEAPGIAAAAASCGVPVHLTGAVPAGEALGIADLLLMTSVNEGLPLAAVEAAAAGIAVVAPPVGGLEDLIRWGGASGAPRTAGALAAVCDRLLGDRALAARRTARARAAVARLSPERLAPAYRRLYLEVAGGGRI